MEISADPASPILSVSALVRAARELLESGFPGVAVEGEISNLARPRSGHVYFTLKDSEAQLRCALFKREADRVGFPLVDGLKVLARGRLSIYPARGEFQLYVSALEEAGLGALQRAFEALKRKLAAEGLFDTASKRAIPRYPSRIGVITSPTGAALRDILNVLARRYPLSEVLIYPVQVQGEPAAAMIAAALARACTRNECDVLLLARGGGSLEDLWPFNEEVVARAIRASTIPIVTGIGHETDFTIADFAADLRAPTPSAAAESAVPDSRELLARLAQLRGRAAHGWRRGARDRGRTLAALSRRLTAQHPQKRLEERAQRLDELAARLAGASGRLIAARRDRLGTLRAELAKSSPQTRMHGFRLRLQSLSMALRTAVLRRGERLRARTGTLEAKLRLLGPEQTLARGYAIVFDERGHVLHEAEATRAGSRITARLARGEILALVEKIRSGRT